MSTCSRGSGSIATKIVRQVRAKLKDLPRLYPNTLAWAILTAAGDVVLEDDFGLKALAGMHGAIVQIARAASAFAATLDEADDAEVVHVQGARCMVTLARCFPGNTHSLVFFTSPTPPPPDDGAGLPAADAQLRVLCGELHHLIASVQQPTTPAKATKPVSSWSPQQQPQKASTAPPTPTISPSTRRGLPKRPVKQ